MSRGDPENGVRPTLLLPATSALLLALAQPPFDLPVLAFTGLVPLALYLHGCGPDAGGRGRALRGALLFGALHFGLTLYWMPVALAPLSWLAVPGWATVVLGLTAVAAGVGWLVWASVRRLGMPLWAALPVAWTAGEWLRGNLPAGLAFPWLELGVSLSAFPELAGAAELVGTRGLGFWMALVSGLLAEATLAVRRGGGRPGRWLVAAALATTLPMAWGIWRAGTLEVRPAARVAVAQTGVGGALPVDPEADWAATRRALDSLLPALRPGEVELLALPEMAVRAFPEEPDGRGALGPLLRHARRLEAPVVFGALGRGEGRATRYNSAFAVEEDGLTAFRYDKRRLVPGVERVPLGMVGLLSQPGDFGAGEEAPLLAAGGARLGVLICYESLYPELARTYRRAGADILLNLTNDAWFGGVAGRPRTTALLQHPAHLVLRAIENRMGVARAAATGVSLFVDPLGRVHEATALGRPALRVRDPGTTDVVTLYARFGDWVGGGSALLAALLAVLATLAPPPARWSWGWGWRWPAGGGKGASLDPPAALH